MGSNYIKNQRRRLWEANPHCENCGVLTILPEDVPGKINPTTGIKQIKHVPDNMATIQHKYDKISGKRHLKDTSEERVHLLWCTKCNYADGILRQADFISSSSKNNKMSTQTLDQAKGAFGMSLLRNASKIKEDRAITILRSAERFYRRKVEDLSDKISDLETARSAALDLSPTDINSLVLASDFKSDEFYANDRKFTMAIREAKVELEEMKTRYEFLFGPFATSSATAVAAEAKPQ